MTLEHDPRTGTEDSGTVSVTAANGTTPQTVYEIPDDALFKVTHLRIQNTGTAAAVLILYDEEDGTATGDTADDRDTIEVGAGATEEVDATYRDFEEDVLIESDGNHDDDVNVTINGVLMTDLKDLSGW